MSIIPSYFAFKLVWSINHAFTIPKIIWYNFRIFTSNEIAFNHEQKDVVWLSAMMNTSYKYWHLIFYDCMHRCTNDHKSDSIYRICSLVFFLYWRIQSKYGYTKCTINTVTCNQWSNSAQLVHSVISSPNATTQHMTKTSHFIYKLLQSTPYPI